MLKKIERAVGDQLKDGPQPFVDRAKAVAFNANLLDWVLVFSVVGLAMGIVAKGLSKLRESTKDEKP